MTALSRIAPGSVMAVACLMAVATAASAQGTTASLLDSPPSEASADDIERFCTNIADAARERRYAIQKAELETLRGEIEDKIAVLEAKRVELQTWAEKREVFSAAASEGLVEVYAKMRPDAAAVRMEKLPEDLTAALLSKLNPRAASTILNEMAPDKAATVTVIMSAAADTATGAEKPKGM